MKFEQPTNDPQNYYWFQNGFNADELKRIYEGVANLPFQQARLIGQDAESAKKSNVRSSKVKWIPKNAEWDWLYRKLMNLAKKANDELWHFDLISADELIQYTEYLAEDEGHYNWHQDIGGGSASRRKVSITVQLADSDEYEGGDLQIWNGGDGSNAPALPRGAGVVIIFPSYMLHRVSKVTKGVRRSFVLWVGGQHYK